MTLRLITFIGALAVMLTVLSFELAAEQTTSTEVARANADMSVYGEWQSPITAASIFSSADKVSSLSLVDKQLYFVEQRAAENGRSVLAKLSSSNESVTLSPTNISVRSRVHEYGGKAYVVSGENTYFSKFSDQKIYLQSSANKPTPITAEGLRYMQCVADQSRSRLICVREDHRTKDRPPINTLVSVDAAKAGQDIILFQGTDFVSSPQISPDAKSVAFISWSHPNMPWDDTELRVLKLNKQGRVDSSSQVTQKGNVAFAKPKFSPDGSLYALADFSDWRTLYKITADNEAKLVLDQNFEIESYGFESNSSIVLTYSRGGLDYLARANLANGKVSQIGKAFSSANSLAVDKHRAYFIGATSSAATAIYKLEGADYARVYTPNGPQVAPAYLSIPQAVSFPTENDEQAFGFFYAPKNQALRGLEGSKPPLIVKVHGGPVASTSATLNPSIQFWTSRGFAVFDVNHRGSTGYGRKFRKKLYPNWGVVDIEDAANGVKWLAAQGLIDPSKVAIRGGSAGGYTTLAAMAFQDVFKAGTSYFGISDLEVLAADTHKFESRYLDQLIGPYPESKDIYIARSPINSVAKIKSPLLLFQGLDDEVVPPNQSEMIFDALKSNCIATAYITYAGEGHGFRQPANNIDSLNKELSFYGQVFGFKPAGNIDEVVLQRCEG